jgi:type I restriction enzyme S subunit
LPPISEDEKPFELPKGWAYTRLDDLCGWITSGSTPPKTEFVEDEGVPYLKVYNIREQRIDFEYKSQFIKEDCHDGKLKRSILYPNDVVMNIVGPPLGKVVIIPCTYPEWNCNQAIAFFRPIESKLSSYIYTYLKAGIFLRYIELIGTAGQDNISVTKSRTIVCPMPPLTEQPRIVAKVDKLMALCDQLKQIILQLAVMGKLVPQDPNDEPASVLLDRLSVERDVWLEENKAVNAECKTMIKKLKKLDEASPPFSLPATWSCVHLIQISRLLVDCHNKTAPYVETGIPIFRTTNIRNREFKFDGLKYVNDETYDYWSRRCPPEPQDIMFTREAPMGEAAIIPEGVKWCLGQRTMLIRVMHDYISNDFLLLALTEPHLLERASDMRLV